MDPEIIPIKSQENKLFSKKILDEALESKLSLTFDDVILTTNYAHFRLDEIDTTTYFSKKTELKIPIVSAAMDSVTEHKMAIAIAKCGGIGIIHRNMDQVKQTQEVNLVKKYLNGLIENPDTVDPHETLSQIKERFEKKYGELRFHSFPIVNSSGELIGMLGERSFKFGDPNQTAEETALTTTIMEKEGTSIEEAYKIMKEKRIGALPLVTSLQKRSFQGMYVFSDVKRIIEGSGYNLDKKGRLKVGAAIGVLDDAYERLDNLIKKVDVVVIDTAHADSLDVIETLKEIKNKYDIDVVVGNISNRESVGRLVKAGADGIKIGQGSGSICTTRVIAGIGQGQISAIYSCAKEAEKYNIPLCADGGIRYSGDITKAIAAGAHSVMLGNLLAGTEETPGEKVYHNGRMWKDYRGMGSLGAMQQHESSKERYGQKNIKKIVPEGVEGLIPYKGNLEDILNQYLGGLRAGMGYTGSKTIEELRLNGDFNKVTESTKKESHPHDILITKEAPNYPRIIEENE